MVYKGRKPVHWCYHCKTALAEAEIEYCDEVSDSIYVKFRFTEKPAPWADQPGDAFIVIWTTTPWTLPANVAVTLAPDADYVAVAANGELHVVAEALVEQVAAVAGWGDHTIVGPAVKGARARGPHVRAPDLQRAARASSSPATTSSSRRAPALCTRLRATARRTTSSARGTACPSPMPVNDDGVFDAGGGPFEGLQRRRGQPEDRRVARAARARCSRRGKTSHSYPHCWRCKNPVIFRATEQWFVSMDATHLRDKALKAIDEVTWIPGWSINRIGSMIADRPDWCISRQRAWGVPIPVFTCVACGETVANDATFDAVEHLFATEGADAWFTRKPAEYLPAGVTCSRCGGSELKPETDILDVWFESGCGARERARRPPRAAAAGRPLPGGLRPASRLVPVVAAHERGRVRRAAVRRRAHARLHRRRRRPQDVQVDRQRRRPARRRRSATAPTSSACGSRPRTTARTSRSPTRSSTGPRRRTGASATRSGSCSRTSTTSTRRPTRWPGTTCSSSTAGRSRARPQVVDEVTGTTTTGSTTASSTRCTGSARPTSRRSTSTCSRTGSTRTRPPALERRSAQTALAAILGDARAPGRSDPHLHLRGGLPDDAARPCGTARSRPARRAGPRVPGVEAHAEEAAALLARLRRRCSASATRR